MLNRKPGLKRQFKTEKTLNYGLSHVSLQMLFLHISNGIFKIAGEV